MTNVPLILAIEMFYDQESLFYSSSALSTYLYGFRHSYVWDSEGKPRTVAEKVDSHEFAGKSIPSGFFLQPDAARISAVLFGNSGTISKFNRMGQQGSHYNPRITLIRFGNCYNPEPDAVVPDRFIYTVGDQQYREWWGQGLEMFHNPAAIHPVDHLLITGISHHWLKDERIYTDSPRFHPYNSITFTFSTFRLP
jgi:hypothetical protein